MPDCEYPVERVTDFALDLLDELRITLLECLLVLKMLPSEADLNFADLETQILLTHQTAKQTHHAASLLHQGAELDERWGKGLSRPKAVFARHSAAVRQGSEQFRPLSMISDEFERRLWQLSEAENVAAQTSPVPPSQSDGSPSGRSTAKQTEPPATRMTQASLGATVAKGWGQRHTGRQRRVETLASTAAPHEPGTRQLSPGKASYGR